VIILLMSIAMAGFGLDRVDLVAGGPGTFINYDIPVAGSDITRTSIRFVEQVQPVWRFGVDNLYVGTSITSQSLLYDAPITDDFSYVLGLETSLLVPRGLRVGAAWRSDPVRVELGVSAITPSGWARFDYTTVTIMPTLALGLTRKP
jgi:hypothetical protein